MKWISCSNWLEVWLSMWHLHLWDFPLWPLKKTWRFLGHTHESISPPSIKTQKKKPIKNKKQANMQPISKPNKLGLYWGYVIYIFQVCTNGLISVGKRYYRRNPKRLTSLRKDVIAAFWANTDVTSASSVSYQIVDEGSSEFREVCLVSGITWGFYDFY